MAQKQIISGNKMSLRSSASKQIKRIESISGNLGSIGDFLVSTMESILLSMVATAAPLLVLIFVFIMGNGIKYISSSWLAVVFILVGAVLLGLNVFFVNPSQGSQAIVSFKYWYTKINGRNKQTVIKLTPYRWAKQDGQHGTLESVYKGHRRYLACIKVHGSVSQTTFDSELEILWSLNRSSIRALERTTVRTTINMIGRPKTSPKIIAPNATPNMKKRRDEITKGVKSQGILQTIDTYVVLDSPSYQELRKKVNNQFTFYRQGLVVTAKQLYGEEINDLLQTLFG